MQVDAFEEKVTAVTAEQKTAPAKNFRVVRRQIFSAAIFRNLYISQYIVQLLFQLAVGFTILIVQKDFMLKSMWQPQ
jgi:hypothetical protein